MYQRIVGLNGAASIVNAMALFAQSVGFTVHRNQVNGSGWVATISAPGTRYITLHGSADTANANISVNIHRGYNAASAWNAQPDQFAINTSTYALARIRVVPVTSIYAFGGLSPTPYLNFAIEVQPGNYRHVNVGQFQLLAPSVSVGTYATAADATQVSGQTGQAVYHTWPFVYNNAFSNYVYQRGGFDSIDNNGDPIWVEFENQEGHSWVGGFPATRWSTMLSNFNIYNGRSVLINPFCYQYGNGLTIPVGSPYGFRYVRINNFQPGDEEVIGDDTWKIFPLIRRRASTANVNGWENEASDFIGIAYLKV